MIGQARPAVRAARHARRATPPAGLTRVGAHAAPDRTHTRSTTQRPAPRGDEDELYRRHHRDLRPRRRPRRQRPARAHRGRLPERLDDPAPRPARADLDLRLALRRRHPRGVPALRARPPPRPPRGDAPGRIVGRRDRRRVLDRRHPRSARGAGDPRRPPGSPARRPHPPGRRLQLRRDRRADRRAHVHQRQQAHRQGPRPRPARAAQPTALQQVYWGPRIGRAALHE